MTKPKFPEPKCPDCNSDELYIDTTSYWSPGIGWVVTDSFDTEHDTIYCMKCDAEFSWAVAIREPLK